MSQLRHYPWLLTDLGVHDAILLLVLIFAAFVARTLALFVLLPPLERLGLTQAAPPTRISQAAASEGSDAPVWRPRFHAIMPSRLPLAAAKSAVDQSGGRGFTSGPPRV